MQHPTIEIYQIKKKSTHTHIKKKSIHTLMNNNNNLLVSFISYEARYEVYHHQKLVPESRNFCHPPAYLATLLHSKNTIKDVKELIAYTKKNVANVLAVLISSIDVLNRRTGD